MAPHILTFSNILYRCFDDLYIGQVSEESLICIKLIHFNPHSISIIHIFVLSQIFSSVQKETLSFLHSPIPLKPHINADLKNSWHQREFFCIKSCCAFLFSIHISAPKFRESIFLNCNLFESDHNFLYYKK